MRRGASTAIVLTLTIVLAIFVVGGCTRPKPTVEPSAQVVASPTIEAPAGATVVGVDATPTLVPTGEMPLDLTQTLAASLAATVTPTATSTSPPGVPTPTPNPNPDNPARDPRCSYRARCPARREPLPYRPEIQHHCGGHCRSQWHS
jgi:hypothetical protein